MLDGAIGNIPPSFENSAAFNAGGRLHPDGRAEISYNSAKEHGAARAGFVNIRLFNRLTFMKLLLSLHGFFDQFCACLALENHGATGIKTFTAIET
jgi:hypothetical protein